MRNIRLKMPLFLGERMREKGDVVPVEDDRRAKQIVDLGHAEFVAEIPPVQTAVVRPPETATAPNAKGK